MTDLITKLRAGIAPAPYDSSRVDIVLWDQVIAARATMNEAADEIESLGKELVRNRAAIHEAIFGLASISNHATPSVLMIRESVRILRSAL